jgi:hypothetical protein
VITPLFLWDEYFLAQSLSEHVARLFSVKRGTRENIAGIESEVMAPMQQQSAEIHALVTVAMETDQNKPEVSFEAAGLLGNPDDALLDDLILIERACG